jgi:hypothetical protein
MRLLLVCLCFLPAYEALSQITTKTAYITGSVVDAETTLPIYDVKISQHFGYVYTTTDSSGFFQIQKLDRDSLIFRHDYYKTYSINVKDDKVNVTLQKNCCASKDEARVVFKELCRKKMIYPAKARREKIQGEVLIGFSLDDHNDIQNIKIIKDIGGNCGDSASKFVEKLPVEMRKMLAYLDTKDFVLPVIFQMDNFKLNFAPPTSSALVLEPVLLVGLTAVTVH